MIDFSSSDMQMDTSVDYSGSNYFPEGWRKVVITGEKTPVLTKKGDMMGSQFTFSDANTAQETTVWFCTDCIDNKKQWCLNRTKAFFVKLAKILQIGTLRSTGDVYNRPFYAYFKVSSSESVKTETDRETGKLVEKKTTFYNNSFSGSPDDVLLSVEDYRSQFDERNETTTERRIVKKAESTETRGERDVQDGSDVPF